jgi:hypothetical protein
LIDGIEAVVQSSTTRSLEVLIPKFPDNYAPKSSPNKFIGGGGLRWSLYDLSKDKLGDCE